MSLLIAYRAACIIHEVTVHLSALQLFGNLITARVQARVHNRAAAVCRKRAGDCDASTWPKQTHKGEGAGRGELLERRTRQYKRVKGRASVGRDGEKEQSVLKARRIK